MQQVINGTLGPDNVQNISDICTNIPSITPHGFMEAMRRFFKLCIPEGHGLDMASLIENMLSDFNEENRLRWPELTAIIVIYTTFIVFGSFGALSIITVVLRQPRMRTSHNIFTVNLAIGDLVLCLFTQPFNLLRILYWHFDWTLGSIMCKAVATAQATNIYVSTLNISVIAMDRLSVIVYPHRKKLQPMGAMAVISCIWVTALLLASPMIAFTSVSNGTIRADASVCSASTIESDVLRQAKMIHGRVTLIVQYLLPMIIVGFAYTRIYYKIRLRQQFLMKSHNIAEMTSIAPMVTVINHEAPSMQKFDGSHASGQPECDVPSRPDKQLLSPDALFKQDDISTQGVDHDSTMSPRKNRITDRIRTLGGRHLRNTSERDRYTQRRQVRTNALLLAITVTFFLSWTPLHVFNLVMDLIESKNVDGFSLGHMAPTSRSIAPASNESSTFTESPGFSSQSPQKVKTYMIGRYVTVVHAFCLFFVHLAACINPILYGWLNENFNKEFKEIIYRCFRWKRHSLSV